MPAQGLHHVDLAVSDVEQSLAFYLDLLGPLGWHVTRRYPTYRGTEEVVYLATNQTPPTIREARMRPADGVAQYYGVGIEHLAFEVDTKAEVDDAFGPSDVVGAQDPLPPGGVRDEPGSFPHSSPSTPTDFAWRCFLGASVATERLESRAKALIAVAGTGERF